MSMVKSTTVIKFLSVSLFYLTLTSIVGGHTFHLDNWSLLLPELSSKSQPSADTPHPVLRPPSSHIAQSKVVFPVPEDVVNTRSYLPDLGFLTDLAFLFILPRGLPASGLVRLSRDLFESEECVQYVSCKITRVARRYQSLDWVNNFLQDFPFQGDVADRLRQGSTDTISKINKRKIMIAEGKNGTAVKGNGKTWKRRREDEDEICTFSCHPIASLTKGLRILTLLHDLVRTVK